MHIQYTVLLGDTLSIAFSDCTAVYILVLLQVSTPHFSSPQYNDCIHSYTNKPSIILLQNYEGYPRSDKVAHPSQATRYDI